MWATMPMLRTRSSLAIWAWGLYRAAPLRYNRRMSLRGRALRNVVLVLITAVCGPAVAQTLTPQQMEEARNHYKAAMTAEKSGDYEGALKEYTAAYEVTKDPKLFYQIGRVNELAGHKEDAV